MAVNPRDKRLDALREQTIDQLIMNYGHGELSLEAFERRLDRALEAADHDALVALTSDLELEVDAGYIERKRRELGLPDAPPEAGDVEYVVSIFGGADRSGAWTVPKELRIITIFGGTDIDLSDARFAAGTTRARVFCLFGGVDIYVPENIGTAVKVLCLFGGVTNKAPALQGRNAPQLVVEGLVLFGGTDVKIRKTFRERLREFADGLRSMFSPAPVPKRD